MASLTCRKCGADNTSAVVRCSDCQALLSRLHPDTVIAGRIRVAELQSEEADALLWSIQPNSAGEARRLWELFPAEALTAGPVFDRAVAVAHNLENGTQLGLHPIGEFWVEKGCMYALEAEPPALSLAEVPPGRLAIELAESLLRRLSETIFACAAATPPLLHGAIGPDAVRFRSWKEPPVIIGSKALRDVLRKGLSPSRKEVLAVDLPALGYTLLGAWSGADPQKLAQDDALRMKVLESISTRSTLAATLDWYTAGGRFLPENLAQLEGFEKQVRDGLTAWRASQYREAKATLAAVLKEYNSGLVEKQWLPAIDMELDKQGPEEAAEAKKKQDQPQPKPSAPPLSPVNAPARNSPALTPTMPTPSQALSGAWRCGKCGSLQYGGMPFCSVCGTRQGAQPSVKPPETEPPRAPRPVVTAPPIPLPIPPAPQPPPMVPGGAAWSYARRRTPKIERGWLYGGLAVTLAAILALVWYVRGNDMRGFNQAIESGRIVSPSGNSAYDLYKIELLKNGGKGTPLAREMAKTAKPHLEKLAETALANFHRSSRLADTASPADTSGSGLNWNAMLQNMTWADVARSLKWLVELDPTPIASGRQAYAQGRVALGQNLVPEARNQFLTALKFIPDWDLAYSALGITYAHEPSYSREKRWDEAERYYKAAIRVSPAWVFPRQNLAELLILAQRLPEAEEQARAAVNIDSNRPDSHEILGWALFYDQQFTESCSELNRALQLALQVTPPPFTVSKVGALRNSACQRAR